MAATVKEEKPEEQVEVTVIKKGVQVKGIEIPINLKAEVPKSAVEFMEKRELIKTVK